MNIIYPSDAFMVVTGTKKEVEGMAPVGAMKDYQPDAFFTGWDFWTRRNEYVGMMFCEGPNKWVGVFPA